MGVHSASRKGQRPLKTHKLNPETRSLLERLHRKVVASDLSTQAGYQDVECACGEMVDRVQGLRAHLDSLGWDSELKLFRPILRDSAPLAVGIFELLYGVPPAARNHAKTSDKITKRLRVLKERIAILLSELGPLHARQVPALYKIRFNEPLVPQQYGNGHTKLVDLLQDLHSCTVHRLDNGESLIVGLPSATPTDSEVGYVFRMPPSGVSPTATYAMCWKLPRCPDAWRCPMAHSAAELNEWTLRQNNLVAWYQTHNVWVCRQAKCGTNNAMQHPSCKSCKHFRDWGLKAKDAPAKSLFSQVKVFLQNHKQTVDALAEQGVGVQLSNANVFGEATLAPLKVINIPTRDTVRWNLVVSSTVPYTLKRMGLFNPDIVGFSIDAVYHVKKDAGGVVSVTLVRGTRLGWTEIQTDVHVGPTDDGESDSVIVALSYRSEEVRTATQWLLLDFINFIRACQIGVQTVKSIEPSAASKCLSETIMPWLRSSPTPRQVPEKAALLPTLNIAYNEMPLLHWAVFLHCSPATVQALLKAGASAMTVDTGGQSALHLAAATCQDEVVSLLCKQGAFVDYKDHGGWTPATIAAVNFRWSTLKLLYSFGASPDELDGDGSTLLHRAAMSNNLKAVQFARLLGATPVKDSHGHTPMQKAGLACVKNQELLAWLHTTLPQTKPVVSAPSSEPSAPTTVTTTEATTSPAPVVPLSPAPPATSVAKPASPPTKKVLVATTQSDTLPQLATLPSIPAPVRSQTMPVPSASQPPVAPSAAAPTEPLASAVPVTVPVSMPMPMSSMRTASAPLVGVMGSPTIQQHVFPQQSSSHHGASVLGPFVASSPTSRPLPYSPSRAPTQPASGLLAYGVPQAYSPHTHGSFTMMAHSSASSRPASIAVPPTSPPRTAHSLSRVPTSQPSHGSMFGGPDPPEQRQSTGSPSRNTVFGDQLFGDQFMPMLDPVVHSTHTSQSSWPIDSSAAFSSEISMEPLPQLNGIPTWNSHTPHSTLLGSFRATSSGVGGLPGLHDQRESTIGDALGSSALDQMVNVRTSSSVLAASMQVADDDIDTLLNAPVQLGDQAGAADVFSSEQASVSLTSGSMWTGSGDMWGSGLSTFNSDTASFSFDSALETPSLSFHSATPSADAGASTSLWDSESLATSTPYFISTGQLFSAVSKNNAPELQEAALHNTSFDVINAVDHLPLLHAAATASIEVQNIVVKHCTDYSVKDDRGRTCLHLAAINDSSNFLRQVHEAKPDVVAELLATKDNEGLVPFHHASKRNFAGFIETALELGYTGSLNDKDLSGNSPLHLAIDLNRDQTIKVLVTHKCRVNEPNGNSDSPLHLAVKRGASLDVVKLLVHNGCDVNARDDHGETPLHSCARRSDERVLQFLLESGASPMAVNHQRQTPLNVAQMQSLWQNVKILLHHGATSVTAQPISPGGNGAMFGMRVACSSCGKQLMQHRIPCFKCFRVNYCSPQCQSMDWQKHSRTCQGNR
eukprot:m.80251 g.80251  ORF g.80251 m.80251 type:complete len:1478 (-) comp12596_c0_seq1:1245-5678(-)